MSSTFKNQRALFFMFGFLLQCSQGDTSQTMTGPVPDLSAGPDLAALPVFPPTPCFSSQSSDWKVSGDSYCQKLGGLCQGVEFYGSSDDCMGTAYTGCWGSGEGACCSTNLANHAGSPMPGSGRWRCVASGTPICGNGKLEGKELCDDGLRNGQACRPGLGNSCSYCSSTCTRVSVTPATSDCIAPNNSDWTVSGDAYCAGRGKSCMGTAYVSGDLACMGTPDTGCWGSATRDCCKSPMADHAGFSDGSARWQCQ